MANETQIRANQENAKRSTGPRSPEGKQRVALNALKHGLTGKQVVLYNENPEDFVADAWRLRRVPLLEAAMHACIKEDRDLIHVRRKLEELRESAIATAKAEAKAKAYEGTMLKVQLPMEQILPLQAAEKELLSNSGDASFEIIRTLRLHADNFENLSRREEALAKSMLRSLNELERIQRRRAGETVPAPAALNVDVNVNHNGSDGSPSEAVTAEGRSEILSELSVDDDYRPKSWSV
jgi:hypothetical protein